MSAAARIFVATETAQLTYGKTRERVIVHKGVTRVREGHPLLRGNSELFEPLRAHYEVDGADEGPALEPVSEPCADCAARAAAGDPETDPAAQDNGDEADKANTGDPASDPAAENEGDEADKAAAPPAPAPVEAVTANPGEKRVTKPRTRRAPTRKG